MMTGWRVSVPGTPRRGACRASTGSSIPPGRPGTTTWPPTERPCVACHRADGAGLAIEEPGAFVAGPSPPARETTAMDNDKTEPMTADGAAPTEADGPQTRYDADI